MQKKMTIVPTRREQESNNAERLWGESWTHVRTMVDTEVEPFLVLDSKLLVVAVNDVFCRVFQVTQAETKDKYIYELGNREWGIISLRKSLEDVVLSNTSFKGFNVSFDFPKIGHKTMMLNARQIHFGKDDVSTLSHPIILLAFEDVSEIMLVAEEFANHTNRLQTELIKQAKKQNLTWES